MTLERIYRFRGLDLRQSNVNRPVDQATNLRNVEIDSQNNLRKRFGYDLLLAQPNTSLQLFENKFESEILYSHGTGIAKLNDAQDAWVDINFAGNAWTTITSPLDTVEYNGVNYFADPDGVNDLYKYDGGSLYRAGIPDMSIDSFTAGASFLRLFYQFIDGQGQTHFGDYEQIEYNPANNVVTDTFLGTDFYTKAGLSSAAQVINSGNLTMSVTSAHTYVAGDSIYGLDSVAGGFRLFLIDSVTATTLVFNAASVGTASISYGNGESVERRTYVRAFISSDPNFGFVEASVSPFLSPGNVATITTLVPFTAKAGDIPFEEVFGDAGIVKGLPPKCKYLTLYNNQLVLGNRADVDAFDPADGNQVIEDSIFWNDLGVGSTIENFPPLNVEVVGKTTEGGISSLSSTQDTLLVFKQDQTYYLSGTLQNTAYRIRNALGVKIGSVSHQSTVEYMGGHLFMSAKGIYFAVGGEVPVETSDKIEPLFRNLALDITGLDLTSAVGTLDRDNEKFYWYIPSSNEEDKIVLVYDYYYKDWFLYDNLKADGGLLISDDVLYHSDGSNIYKRNATYNDNNTAISAFYSSNWHHLGVPSLRKKFVNFIGLSTGGQDWTLTLTTQVDWDTATNVTNQDITFSSTVRVQDKKINITQKYANRFTLANSTLNEGLFLNGYEYEWQATQTKPKGSD